MSIPDLFTATSSGLMTTITTTAVPLSDAQQYKHMSPVICKQGILNRFEELANQLAMGWKFHVSNTEGIKEAWVKFEAFYQNVCSFTEGRICC
uniref:Uncharacterized protein n=1 Tax=Ditylenchus dipsaci TaxID=166011 RepID=A0A915DGF8_9BILA